MALSSTATDITLPDPDGEGELESPQYTYVYDAAAQLTSETDPLGRETSYVYDNLGRTITVIEPDPDGAGQEESPESNYAYDAAGNLLSVTDPLGKTTDYTYDNLGRLITTELPDPDGQGSLGRPTTSYSYDAAGNVTSLTDPVGNTTAWVYDGLDRVIAETNELEDTRYFSYDTASHLIARTDRNGRVTQYDYDNLGRMIQERWVDGETTLYTANYAYDAASRLLTATDDFSSYEYTYDGLGRVTLVESDNGGPVVKLSQEFDAAGNRTVLSSQVDVGSGFDDDFVNTYTYDNLGRLTRIEQQGVQGGNAVAEKRVDFAYNAASQYASIARYDDLDGGSGNEVATTAYGYDGIGRLTSLTHTHDTTEIADYAWSYDAFSRVTSMSFDSLVGDNGSSTYSYDDTDQLTGADHDFQTDEGYEFDENGNRAMGGYDIGPNNQLLSDGTFDYQYDAEGNRILRTRISTDPADDYITEYEWDYHNRLTKITYKNNEEEITKEVEYTYDVFNRRIAKSIDWDGAGEDDPVGVEYVYSGWNILLTFDGESSLTNRYLHGPGEDNILADEQFSPSTPAEMPSAPGDLFWMLADNLGSVRDIVDSDGNVENHLTYDGFGNVVSETDSGFNHIGGFQGSERDKESGMQLHDRRFYDPTVGRWLSEDPIGFSGGDSNLARFTANKPTNFTDPRGLDGPFGPINIPPPSKEDLEQQKALEEAAQQLEELIKEKERILIKLYPFTGPTVAGIGAGLLYETPYQKWKRTIRQAAEEAVWKDFEADWKRLHEALTQEHMQAILERLRNGEKIDGITTIGDIKALACKEAKRDTIAFLGFDPTEKEAPTPRTVEAGIGSARALKLLQRLFGACKNFTPAMLRLASKLGSTRMQLYLALRAKGITALQAFAAAKYRIDLFTLTMTATVAKHIAERPYIVSPLTIRNIIATGKPIPDPGGVAGALRWDVAGTFRGVQGIYELVIDPKTNTILHFVFKSK